MINILEINRTAKEYDSDKYYKKFKTYDHLVTMMFAIISNCTSLRDISNIILACEGKINHLNLVDVPRRSTLSDANKNRNSEVFAAIYSKLYQKYRKFLSDSSSKSKKYKNLYMVDSSTISLFSNLIQGVGRNPVSGKKKGGIKMHTMVNALEDTPCLVRFTSAKVHDHVFLADLELKKGSFVVFDKGYNDYNQFAQWNLQGVYFVTRMKSNAKYQEIKEYHIEKHIHDGILKDERVKIQKDGVDIEMRRVIYWHDEQKRLYEFITNNFELDADIIADIYKERWNIELLFKRLKQNFPLKYFLGDTQNAIEIQIWVSLIVQLIMLVINRKATKKWAFSNMVGVIRYHQMSYIDIYKFLNNPNARWRDLTTRTSMQLALF